MLSKQNTWDERGAAASAVRVPATVDPIQPVYQHTPSPQRLVLIVAASIFVGEALVMLMLFRLPAIPPLWAGVLDATAITLLILPCLYFFLMRPLTQEIEERKRFETALSAVNLELDQRIQARTQELSQTNAALTQEIQERMRTEEALRQAHDSMEFQVQERTRDLARANQDLRLEVAERKRVEQQLHLQTRALHAAGQGIVITDRAGLIRWVNPAFTSTTGFTAEEALGQTPNILNSEQHSPAFFGDLWQTVLSGQTWQGEIINRRKDGTLFVDEQTITPVINEQGDVTHFITIMRDISERKRAEEHLAQINQDLLSLSQAEHEQRRLAEALALATKALSSTLNLNDVLDQILEQIAQVTSYYAAAIFMVQDDWVEIPRHRRFSGAVHTHPLIAGFPLSTVPQLSRVAATGRPMLVHDTEATADWTAINGLEWIRSCMIVPLLEGTQVIGFLATVSDEPDFFQEKSMTALSAFAAHATVAMQNAWLFQQVQSGHQRLQSLSHRLVETQEAERRYIARELHDEAGQTLTSLLFGLGQLVKNAHQPEIVASTALELRGQTEEIMEALHRLAVNLRPASLDHLGLQAALAAYTGRLAEQHGLRTRFRAVGLEDRRLPLDLETALYRIAQETLTNVLRHAQATSVDVLVQRHGERITLLIEDNGVGFNVASASQNNRLGLLGARERCEMLGGTLVIESNPGTGTTIVAEIPYADSYSVC